MSTEPKLGLSGEYASNPQLRSADPLSEEHAAALFTVPLTYDADALECTLNSSGRVSNARGYSSLASNVFHVDAGAQLSTDRGSTSLQAGWNRDSTLYHIGELSQGVGVRRDTENAAGDWTYAVTARSQVALDANWSHVRYGQPDNLTSLVDYRYWSAGPSLGYSLSEISTLKFIGNAGDYQSLNGQTTSKSENVQLSYIRTVSELWTLTTSGGYSHAANTAKEFFGPFYLGAVKARQNGAVYSAALVRKAEGFSVTLNASRALAPTGLAFLSRQDTYSINSAYVRSERWDFSASASWQKARNPVIHGPDVDFRYLTAQVAANWHWTPQWYLTLRTIHVQQQYGTPLISAHSSGVNIEINRQFLRTEL